VCHLRYVVAAADRPRIKPINAKREDVLSMVGTGRGIGLIGESANGNIVNGAIAAKFAMAMDLRTSGLSLTGVTTTTIPPLSNF
jgi:hypothetical protein